MTRINAINIVHERGLILYRQRRYKQAADEFRRELEANNDNAWAHGMLALSLSFDEKHEAALAEGKTAIATGPAVAFAHYALANVIVRQPHKTRRFRLSSPQMDAARRLKLSRKSCLEAVRLNPDYADALGLLSAIEFDLRHFRKSASIAERGLRADPTHQYCANMRGRALHQLGWLDDAESTYDKALMNNPESTITHTNRGWTRMHKGDFVGAAEHFREALRLDPTNKRAETGFRSAKNNQFILFRPFAKTLYWLLRVAGRTTIFIAAAFAFFIIRTNASATHQEGISWSFLLIGLLIIFTVGPSLTAFSKWFTRRQMRRRQISESARSAVNARIETDR